MGLLETLRDGEAGVNDEEACRGARGVIKSGAPQAARFQRPSQ